MLAVALTSLPAPAQLPTLGDGSEMSLAAERRLGDHIAREIYRDPDFVDDPLLADYLRSVWQPLQNAARQRGELTPEMEERFAWDLVLVRDRSINAFALPGGYLGVHLGLIGLVATRDELASVLAHELTHVTQRHISRLSTQQGQTTPLLLAAMVLGVLAASKSPNAAGAVMAGSQALAVQSQLNFSRDMEREADRIGYSLMAQAGYAPGGFVTMFEKLQQAARLNDNGAYPYLRSHPLTSQRIADMQLRFQEDKDDRADPRYLTDGPRATLTALGPARADLLHGLMAARARVLADTSVDSLRRVVAQAQLMATPATLYAATLASLKLRHFDHAYAALQRLQSALAGNAAGGRQGQLLAIELALAAGQPQEAAALFLTQAAPLDRPTLFLQAQTALALRQVPSAQPLDIKTAGARIADTPALTVSAVLQSMQLWVHTHPQDASGWQWLGRLATAQGLPLLALRAEAEMQLANLDWVAALDRLKAAQDYAYRAGLGKQAGDHIDASIIDTRLREVQAQVRQMSREKTL